MLRRLLFVWVLVSLAGAAIAAEPLIWVEGEQAAKKQLVDNAGLNDVNPDELSGGKWICSFSHEQEPTGTAEYAAEIPAAGDLARPQVRMMRINALFGDAREHRNAPGCRVVESP